MQCLLLVVGLVAAVLTTATADGYTDVVQTSSGPIRGEEVTFQDLKYSTFKGIPYAAPPVGDLRFRAPQPPAKWTEVRNATDFGTPCLQPRRRTTPPTSEDCLTLNVYTPSLSENASKPVIFGIHGGSFAKGDSLERVGGVEHFMENDLVVVGIRYRLGPIGFLATNTTDSSGNWGLKDQVAALRWVQENIHHFGGDPKNVIIYGESAGSASVHLHLFSPLSKGLFHKAIASSGSALNAWPLKSEEQQQRYSQNLARLLGASETEIQDPTKRVEYLRQADARNMTDQMYGVIDPKYDTKFPFTPVIEPVGTEGAFLTEHPKKLLAEGRFNRVPIMMGANSLEGAAAYFGLKQPSGPETMTKTEENVCQILPDALRDAVIAKNGCPEVAQLIRDAYFRGKHFNTSLIDFIYLSGDLFITKDVIFSQRLHARYSNETFPLYNYYFAFDGRWNLKQRMKIPLPGAGHGDELLYIFKPNGTGWPDLPPSSKEVITQKRFSTFIANFAKHGNPTPTVSDLIPIKWLTATELKPATLVIGDDLVLEREVLETRIDMWDKLEKKYADPPRSQK